MVIFWGILIAVASLTLIVLDSLNKIKLSSPASLRFHIIMLPISYTLFFTAVIALIIGFLADALNQKTIQSFVLENLGSIISWSLAVPFLLTQFLYVFIRANIQPLRNSSSNIAAARSLILSSIFSIIYNLILFVALSTMFSDKMDISIIFAVLGFAAFGPLLAGVLAVPLFLGTRGAILFALPVLIPMWVGSVIVAIIVIACYLVGLILGINGILRLMSQQKGTKNYHPVLYSVLQIIPLVGLIVLIMLYINSKKTYTYEIVNN